MEAYIGCRIERYTPSVTSSCPSRSWSDGDQLHPKSACERQNSHTAMVNKGWEGILAQFIETDPATGRSSLTDTCQVAGLGGRGNRSGTFEYYMSEKRVSNDPKGLAPFILGALEMERR